MSPNGSDRSPRRPMRRKLLQALTAGLVLATATGCTWEDFPRLGMPTPTTEEAPLILSLWQGSWAAALAIGALVWGLILWSAFFHRRSRTKVEVPPQTRYNMPIEALYTVVPLIIVSVFFYFTARDESELMKLDAKPDVTVNVVGFQWSWCFNYIENVEGSTGDAKTDKDSRRSRDLYKDAFPARRRRCQRLRNPLDAEPADQQPGPHPVAAEGGGAGAASS
ncbi:cytochrome c oxidase subunit II [Streptomyces hirsutus]